MMDMEMLMYLDLTRLATAITFTGKYLYACKIYCCCTNSIQLVSDSELQNLLKEYTESDYLKNLCKQASSCCRCKRDQSASAMTKLDI